MEKTALRSLSPVKLMGLILCLGLSILMIFQPGCAAHKSSSDNILALNDGNIGDAMENVKAGDLSLFVMFFSDSCRHCRDAFPAVNKLADVLAKGGISKLKVGKVDAIANREASEKYNIAHFPTFYFFGSSSGGGGVSREEYEGPRTVGAFLKFLKDKYPLFIDNEGNPTSPLPFTNEHEVIIEEITSSNNKDSMKEVVDKIKTTQSAHANDNDAFVSYELLRRFAVRLSKDPEPKVALKLLKDTLSNLDGVKKLDSDKKVKPNLDYMKHQAHLKFIVEKMISSYEKKLAEAGAKAHDASAAEDLSSKDI